jgi:hypothetical protein
MDIQDCRALLYTQYTINPTEAGNISKFTSDARGNEKSICITKMWWIVTIRDTIKWFSSDNVYSSDYASSREQESIIHQSAGNPIEQDIQTHWSTLLFQSIWIILLLWFIWRFAKIWFKFLYIFANNHRMKYYRVLLPRWDGKSDREEQKDLAKDMKEKIWRMSQVFMNLSRLWKLNSRDTFMNFLFSKPRVSFVYHYEDGKLFFIVATYPEYESVLQSSIWSQYADASIERIVKPDYFSKKYSEIVPLESEKDCVYTLKMYKQANDDQINNILDAISSISREDTVSIVMTVSPLSEKWNEITKNKVNRLYKNLPIESKLSFLTKPWKLIQFIIKGPNQDKFKDEWNVTMVRMVKAKEDSINAMAEEAGSPAFITGIMIIISSNDKQRTKLAMNNIISAYSVYTDEYGNELKHPTISLDFLPFIVKPLRRLTVNYCMTYIFYPSNQFGVNELASLFHLPTRIYNRSDAIQRMQYKVIAPPDTLPQLMDDNGFVMTGIIAEDYKKWILSDILREEKYINNNYVGDNITREEKIVPFDSLSPLQQQRAQIVYDENGVKMGKVQVEKKQKWYKLYKDGILLGVNIHRNNLTPVYMKRNDRTRHHYIIGKSGTGKSVFIEAMARQDIWNGDWLCLIDPHWDLAEWLLQYIPKERAKDVVYFDAWNEERPMWLNLYEINTLDEADRTVNDATEIFLKMFWPEIFGPRIQEYFKYGSLTLLEDFEDRPTLLDVTRLYTDDAYREYKTKKVTNAVVKNFWDKTYNAMGDREKQEIIPYFSSKFVSFNTNRLIRNIIGQTHSAFDFEDIMNNQKILIINLSKGKTGELNSQLLGMIIVSKIYNGAMARARMEEKDRKDFYLYVDEFQNFISWTFADILSEARKYRLCLIMAHQYIAQLEWGGWNNIGQEKWGKSDVKSAVFGNVWTMMSFKIGAPDAEFLEKEYAPVLSGQDIIGIANYKSYVKLNINNSTTRPFSMNSIYTSDYKNKKIAHILKEYCAKKYGRKREFVDAEITARLGIGIDEENLPEQTTEVESSQYDKNWEQSNNTSSTNITDNQQNHDIQA